MPWAKMADVSMPPYIDILPHSLHESCIYFIRKYSVKIIFIVGGLILFKDSGIIGKYSPFPNLDSILSNNFPGSDSIGMKIPDGSLLTFVKLESVLQCCLTALNPSSALQYIECSLLKLKSQESNVIISLFI